MGTLFDVRIHTRHTYSARPWWRSWPYHEVLSVKEGGVTILMVEQNARKALTISD
jgi:hypothetical protein